MGFAGARKRPLPWLSHCTSQGLSHQMTLPEFMSLSSPVPCVCKLFCWSTVYGCCEAVAAELRSCDRLYGLQSLKYVLSGLLPKLFADPGLR